MFEESCQVWKVVREIALGRALASVGAMAAGLPHRIRLPLWRPLWRWPLLERSPSAEKDETKGKQERKGKRKKKEET